MLTKPGTFARRQMPARFGLRANYACALRRLLSNSVQSEREIMTYRPAGVVCRLETRRQKSLADCATESAAGNPHPRLCRFFQRLRCWLPNRPWPISHRDGSYAGRAATIAALKERAP